MEENINALLSTVPNILLSEQRGGQVGRSGGSCFVSYSRPA